MSFTNLDSIRKRVADLADSAAELASQTGILTASATDQLIADATAAGILDRARTSGED